MSELLAIKTELERFEEWENAFRDCDIDVTPWDQIADKSAVDYALVWKPEPGWLATFPNLKIIFSVGAGLDHLKGENLLPPGIPVVRMVESGLTEGMIEYVLFNVLRYHRFMDQYEIHKVEKRWERIEQIPPRNRTVGILGMGELGRECGLALANLGFNVLGWSQSEKMIPGITSYFGDRQLNTLLKETEILVCLLPLTDQTRNILNGKTFSKMPRSSYVINAGRGGHQVESDILHALDSGQLAGAALDVFETEPLPQDHPLWSHPKVYFTPHVASMTLPATSSVHVYDNIVRNRNGEPLTHIADMERGY